MPIRIQLFLLFIQMDKLFFISNTYACLCVLAFYRSVPDSEPLHLYNLRFMPRTIYKPAHFSGEVP